MERTGTAGLRSRRWSRCGALLTAGLLSLAVAGCSGGTTEVSTQGPTGERAAATTNPNVPPPCVTDLPPKGMPLPTDVDLNLSGTTPNDAGASQNERTALERVLVGDPALARFLQQSKAELTIAVPWHGAQDQTIGWTANFRFPQPTDIPTTYGEVVTRTQEPKEDVPLEIEVDKDGLPVLAPVSDPKVFSQRSAMILFVATTSGGDVIHHLQPTDMTADSCGDLPGEGR